MNIFLSTNANPKTKSEKVRHFIRDVGVPLNVAPVALGLTANDFMRWWSGAAKKVIYNSQLAQLGQFLNIDENDIIKGSYDKDFVRSVLFSEATLPSKYLENQYSSLRTSAHILKYLAMTRGQHFSDMILRKMNISPLIYTNHDNKISLNYFVDLLAMLAENGLTPSELDDLACVMFLTLGQSPIGKRFGLVKTYYDCYQLLASVTDLFDTNFVYNFELHRTQVIIRAFLPYDKHAQIDWTKTNLNKLFRYRRILIGWFPFLSKLPPILPKTELKYLAAGIEETYKIIFTDRKPSPFFLVRS